MGCRKLCGVPDAVDDVLEFWFGDGSPEATRRWWTRDEALDAEIRARFGELHDRAGRRELDSWRTSARGSLALVVLLDQFSRNMFRDDPRAFATDAQALAITHELIASGRLAELTPLERSVALMPLMHSEDRDIQRESIAQFAALSASQPGDAGLANNLEFAKRHAAIVERFGRYPHRNAVLGRASTPEEQEFLTQPGSSF